MSKTIRYSKHISFKNFSNFTYVINEVDKQAYVLENTAALVWREIGKSLSISDIYARCFNYILAHRDNDYVLTQGDFSEFCESLLSRGLVEEIDLEEAEGHLSSSCIVGGSHNGVR